MTAISQERPNIYFSAGGVFDLLRPVTPEVFAYRGVNKKGDRSIDFLIESFPERIMEKYGQLLQGISTPIHEEVFQIPSQQAIEEVAHNFRGKGRNRFKGRSIILARLNPENQIPKKETPPPSLLSALVKYVTRGRWGLRDLMSVEKADDYVGYGAIETWTLPPGEGHPIPLRIGYLSDIAIKDAYRRLGLGAYFFNVANSSLHPDILVMRIRSGAVIAALEKSKVSGGNPSAGGNPRFALEIPYDDDFIMQAALNLADENTIHPNKVNKSTGATEFVYAEMEDRAYIPDPTHAVANAADLQLQRLGVKASEGGAAYVAVRVRGREAVSSFRRVVS